MDPSECDLSEFFPYYFAGGGVGGKKKPTNPLCGALLMPAHVPCCWGGRTPAQNKLHLGVNGLVNAESTCEGSFAGLVRY